MFKNCSVQSTEEESLSGVSIIVSLCCMFKKELCTKILPIIYKFQKSKSKRMTEILQTGTSSKVSIIISLHFQKRVMSKTMPIISKIQKSKTKDPSPPSPSVEKSYSARVSIIISLCCIYQMMCCS